MPLLEKSHEYQVKTSMVSVQPHTSTTISIPQKKETTYVVSKIHHYTRRVQKKPTASVPKNTSTASKVSIPQNQTKRKEEKWDFQHKSIKGKIYLYNKYMCGVIYRTYW